MTQYNRGANFERRIAKHLESQGWFVLRSAGSHKPVDLAAFRAGEVMFIQCQLDSYFPPAKRETLYAVAKENTVQAFLAWREKKQIVLKRIDEENTTKEKE